MNLIKLKVITNAIVVSAITAAVIGAVAVTVAKLGLSQMTGLFIAAISPFKRLLKRYLTSSHHHLYPIFMAAAIVVVVVGGFLSLP